MRFPLHHIRPSPALEKYVAFYYFVKSDDPNFRSAHYSFPHTYSVLSIYKNVEPHYKEDHFITKGSESENIKCFVQIKKQAPLLVELYGKTDRITVLFKDLGLNQFIDDPLSQVMGKGDNSYNGWDNDPLFMDFSRSFFASPMPEERIKILEEFLLAIIKPQSFTEVEQALPFLTDFDRSYTITEIADKLGISSRTLNRKFKDAIGVSPIEYRRIAQFRHSLNSKIFSEQFRRLTDIGYGSNFYDQSYFNKVYKKLTGSNPKVFFNAVDRLADDQLIFQFVKNSLG